MHSPPCDITASTMRQSCDISVTTSLQPGDTEDNRFRHAGGCRLAARLQQERDKHGTLPATTLPQDCGTIATHDDVLETVALAVSSRINNATTLQQICDNIAAHPRQQQYDKLTTSLKHCIVRVETVLLQDCDNIETTLQQPGCIHTTVVMRHSCDMNETPLRQVCDKLSTELCQRLLIQEHNTIGARFVQDCDTLCTKICHSQHSLGTRLLQHWIHTLM